MAEGFCIKCGVEVESFEGLSCCPACKTVYSPCCFRDQMNVNINIQELRVLCMWAERWVNVMKNEQTQATSAEVLRSIATRLSKQLPKETCLLLSDELKAIKDKGLDVESSFIDL